MDWRVGDEATGMDWPAERPRIVADDFLLAFVLTGDSDERLPSHVCGVQVSVGHAVEEDREYLDSCTHSRTPQSWFTPGFNALTVRVTAPDRSEAVRQGWQAIRAGARFLSTYIRPPRPGLDLQQQRIIEPTGWVMVSNQGAMRLVSYYTWALMTISFANQVGDPEARYNQELFARLSAASNQFWTSNRRPEDRIRIERAVTWYGRSLTVGDYATTLLHGWMATVPLVIGANEPSGLMLDRLQALAERHGYGLERRFYEDLRRARNEVAHEASMANADPLAVDTAQISHFLHPLRLLFLMALLFALEAEPPDGPLLDKWKTISGYRPTVVVDDNSAPFWHAVPEILGICD
jgi:hypothetical protein